ncbi:hypothetical protein [Micromonospora chalcea]|uniref:hypothetical protein n=1 Tax=Micromonospora chalcea TaxID=1874 RepID=UPI000CE51741|nr:hypothetical protein [Micromonospora chalcea]PPA60414.1 hypothetical protein BAW75_01270 [Micromonospora chalcea]
MSALTSEIKDRNSPVAQWLSATFPHYKEIQTSFRTGAGSALVLPSKQVNPGTQGAAIDFWLRMVVDPHPSIDLPLAGLLSRRAPCLRAGAELLRELAGGQIIKGAGTGKVELRMCPAEFTDRSDQWWARVCYALALLVELYRAPSVERSRLMRLSPASGAGDLLGLTNDDEVADLIAMRDLALKRLRPALPPGPVATGMTFDGSADLNADADLIAGGMLIDFKAGQGGSLRADGTRAAQLARTDLYQLLGYALMDYSDAYRLQAVAIYAVRFGYLAAWPLDELCAQMAGHPVNFTALRRDFAHVLRVQLSTQRTR